MTITISTVSPIVFAIAVAYALHKVHVKVTHWRIARKLGCKPAYVRPSKWPLGLDNLARAMKATNEQVLQNDDIAIYEELGCRPTWVQNILGGWYHTTADPENIKAMLATQFKDFELGPLRFQLFEPLLGHGIFTSDGKEWQQYRSLLRPQFSRSQISNLELEEIHVKHLLDRFTLESGYWTAPVDLAPLFFNLTLDTATEFLFGKSVESQIVREVGADDSSKLAADDAPDCSSFSQAFDHANAIITYQSRLMDLYFLYSPKSLYASCKQVHRFADYYVNRALAARTKKPEEDGKAKDESAYIFLDELAKSTQDPDMLRSQLLNILLAGRDTTAGLLGWTFYWLARSPDEYETLRKTVVDTFGAFSSDVSAITFETLKSCSHLQHVISEILRLHAIVPENSRRAVRNTTLPRGGGKDGLSPIYIRAGEEVIYNTHVMHHRKDLWGDDADEFRPARWEGRKVGWEYLPFNGGPRICLGQQFALTEAAYVIVRLVQKFDKIDNLDREKVTRHQFTSTTAPTRVLVKLHEAPAE